MAQYEEWNFASRINKFMEYFNEPYSTELILNYHTQRHLIYGDLELCAEISEFKIIKIFQNPAVTKRNVTKVKILCQILKLMQIINQRENKFVLFPKALCSQMMSTWQVKQTAKLNVAKQCQLIGVRINYLINPSTQTKGEIQFNLLCTHTPTPSICSLPSLPTPLTQAHCNSHSRAHSLEQ